MRKTNAKKKQTKTKAKTKRARKGGRVGSGKSSPALLNTVTTKSLRISTKKPATTLKKFVPISGLTAYDEYDDQVTCDCEFFHLAERMDGGWPDYLKHEPVVTFDCWESRTAGYFCAQLTCSACGVMSPVRMDDTEQGALYRAVRSWCGETLSTMLKNGGIPDIPNESS